MATRMQQRRGTATQWTTANPILAAAEIGFESDTGKFKIGDGTNHWADLSYFLDSSAAGIQDAINSAIAGLVDGAPELLNTMKELSAAIGNDPEFFATLSTQMDENVAFSVSLAQQYADGLVSGTIADNISAAISSHESDTTNVHGISNTADLVTQSDLNNHATDTTNVHGIANTQDLATQSDVETARLSAESFSSSALNDHATDTTNVHGISDTSILAVQSDVTSAENNAKSYADGVVGTHSADTTSVHGIADTSLLATQEDVDSAVNTHNSDSTSVHGIADTADLVVHAELDAHASDTTNIHGIANTANLATKAYADAAVAAHEADTTSVHGIADTSALATKTYADSAANTAKSGAESTAASALSSHEADTTNIHGIADTSALATKTYADSAVSTHEADTTSVHGITDTSKLITTDGTQTLTNKTITSPSGLVKADVGLGNVNNTSDANKPVSTATQTALDAKAPLASPTFTGTVSGITKSMVGLGNVDNTSDANKPVSTATQTALDLKAPLASPTFTGTTTAADVTITGNLTVSGTTTTVDSQNLAVTDSLIYLAKNQYSADALDIGIYGAYGASGNNGGNHPHTGLVRDASDGKWKLISGGAEPTGNEVDFTTATKDALVIGALDATSATIGNVSNTELQYLDGVTSAIQTQIDNKAPLASPTFTGTVTLPTGTVTSEMILDGTIVNADINASAAIAATKISGTAVTQADTGTVTNTMLAGSIAPSKVTGTAITAADSGTVTSAMIADGTIVNGDISSSAAIATSKISGLDAALSAKAPTASPTFTGTVTVASSGIAFTDGTQTKEGVPSRTPIVQKTASYTLSAVTERDSLIEVASSSATTITIPANSAVAYPVGTSIDILQTSTGQVTIAGDTGVTVNATPGLKLRAQWSSATLFKRATDTWVVMGDLSA